MAADDAEVRLELHRAHSARMYDYYLGGTTNFAADREAAGQVMAVFPWAETAARVNRSFMHRSTRLLALAGIRQFLDIGTGIPTRPNLHEIAQQTAPECRIVYTDNDPIVLAHAQALLLSTPQGRTAYVEADVTDPAAVLASAQLRATLDLARPVALSLNALLHFVPDSRGAKDIVEYFKSELPSGSALVITHGSPDFAPEQAERITQVYAAAGTAVQMRTRDEIARFLDGWELLEPGLVATHRWRPEGGRPDPAVTDSHASAYAAVAFKP
ncbi:SAM-dependent methyltransferase [Kitasatospora sp. NPDC048540]|uniref:SAM-dependent methyltransferase n=1 Tax=unclassified Kitasatospora TaxID=2633591 RepID=UPI00053A5CCE|nr:SAM-dependent methyltransferase [Kitasatospora sp. MBT63]